MRRSFGSEWIEENYLHNGGDCITWPFSRDPNGYPSVLRVGGEAVGPTRVICARRWGPPPTPKHEAAHSCGKGHEGCMNPMHLSWKTHQENCADRAIHGTENRGGRNGSAKLTEDQVREIRAMRGIKTQAALAIQFGVSDAAIQGIHERRKWAWLE